MTKLSNVLIVVMVLAAFATGFVYGVRFAYINGVYDGMCHVVNSLTGTFTRLGGEEGERALGMCKGVDINMDMI